MNIGTIILNVFLALLNFYCFLFNLNHYDEERCYRIGASLNGVAVILCVTVIIIGFIIGVKE